MSATSRFPLSTRFSSKNDDSGSNITRSDISRGDASNAEDDAKLGFAALPDQMHRKSVKKGFNFTIMVVGESGLGKSTMIQSMFMRDMYENREIPPATDRIECTTRIEKHQLELDEKGIKLRLTVVDTPGFYDAVNASNCWKPIEEYIDGTFDQYFKDECGINRKQITDDRVHCCLYFVSPYGHGLRPIDVEFMRRLHRKVNIVPVIAKADTLTASELRALKEQVLADIERHQIDVYRPPECDSDEDADFKRQDAEIKRCIPFAVIGGNKMKDVNGKKVRVREYPWGTVEIESTSHCDFTYLRVFLLRTHMQDLKDMTRDVHYENYRANYITERMCKRQSDRVTNSTGAEFTPAAPVDPALILKQKEEELQRMQQLVEKMQTQLKSTTLST